ncbi:MAG TPA: short chain dehydrogenase [Gemmatimonadales bacterium]|nr:short chain dehydrogenase [Gemmatimonadales bacterium]
MRVLVVGATGTIGQAVADALRARHEVVAVTRKSSPGVDLGEPASIRALYQAVGPVDAVVCVAGAAAWKPLADLGDADYAFSLANKLMGQVNLVRYGREAVRANGSFTVTSGILAQRPMPGSAAVSLVNAGIEGFVRAAALEIGDGRRVNVVSPGWVSETLEKMGQDPKGGTPAHVVAEAYVASVEGSMNGAVIPAEG